MKKQTGQQQETHGKITNHVNDKNKQQTKNTELLSLKAGYNQHASLSSEPRYSKTQK